MRAIITLPSNRTTSERGKNWYSGVGWAAVLLVALSGRLVEWLQLFVFDRGFVEALVAAIVLGALLRAVWRPSRGAAQTISFLAKLPLESAIVLMGFSLGKNAARIVDHGALFVVMAFVAFAIIAGWGIGRALGLSSKMAVLIACGNAICGNSAIAAVGPAIQANEEEVTAAIAFTAVISVVVVLLFPIVALSLNIAAAKAGAIAGLIVYAVPQVIAATAPLGTVAVQSGTIIKLLRVLMLGPICIGLSIFFRNPDAGGRAVLQPALLVPWFIVGFIAAALAQHWLDLPQAILAVASQLGGLLTLVSMAALGLSVDLSKLWGVSGRATATVGGSLAVLIAASSFLIWWSPI